METKPKGIIRTGAVVPAAIFVLVSFLYFHFLFESHVRKGIEWTASYVHGAEVNVGGVSLSFLNASFRMRNLQITDKSEPSRNLVEIGDIRFKFSWDALLRLKFLVEDAAIDGIAAYSPRTKPGWVRPPEPPDVKNPSLMAEVESNALNQVKEDYQGNVLGDTAKLLEGSDADDLLKDIQSELKAEAKIKQLESELKNKEQEWKERFDNLPHKEEFEKIAKEIKSVDLKTKNPVELAANVKKIGDLVKEADKKADAIKAAAKNLRTDISHYSKEIEGIDDLVKDDIRDIEKRLNIPDFDSGDFSKNLFAKIIAAKLGSLQKYMTVAREYMPPPKKDGEKKQEIVPPARGQGRDYRFTVTTGYPLFWLKKATISSRSTDGGFSGDVSGQLTDLTTDPAIVQRPMILDVKGDFPKSQVFATRLLLTVDHVGAPKEKLELAVGQFPVRDFRISNSEDVGLALATAKGKSYMAATLENQRLAVNMTNDFTELKYDLKAKSNSVREALNAILGGIPTVTLNANASGTWGDLDIHINSNLGKELSRGLQSYVKAKVDALRVKIKAQIEDRVKGKKDELSGEYKKIKDSYEGQLKKQTDEIDKEKNKLQAESKSSQSSSKEKLKKDLKEKGKKLLKGLKF